ncbi:MAG: anthranilate synthase component I [Deltaproteobacteria bacterium]|nr:anthranilate synthase component I [Deltaproteobacteria bacterium]
MISLTFEKFQEMAEKGNLIPLSQEIPADLETPVSAFLKIRTFKNDFLLESVVGGEKWGRFSFLGTEPRALFKSKGHDIEIFEGHKRSHFRVSSNPLDALKEFLSRFNPVVLPDLPRFFGGAVGYLAYDMVRSFENLPQTAVDELKVFDACFFITDTVIIFDNFRQVIIIVANVFIDPEKSKKVLYEEGLHKIEKLVKKLQQPLPPQQFRYLRPVEKSSQEVVLKATRTEEEFCALVEKAGEYIAAGDIFQVVLSTRFEGKTAVPPFELYRAIRRMNPSPYLYFLQYEDLTLVGASPEVMVRLEDGKVELRPIAGTRRRGGDISEDLHLMEELKKDPKERAEHIMLVDLGRNDLGRVCEIGSVAVNELETVELYSHVMHLVSHVSGKLKPGLDAFDVIRAAFPAGTLTGAPKIRAMEIIEELEEKKRGIYGGCVGYISYTGNLDTAITIRTALFKDGKIYIQAGAGIVANSVPKLEYKECRNKAEGMMAALKSVGV